uniref:Nrx1 n=1 Tax=Arundo donax TaxID=35708 RepID=A0A0A9HLW5_ARUDO
MRKHSMHTLQRCPGWLSLSTTLKAMRALIAGLSEYGAEAYPFTREMINELKKKEKAAKDNQTIHSVLGTHTRDYLISNKGDRVPISELEVCWFVLCGQ